LTRLGEEARGRLHFDPMIGVDDTSPKSDGRNVPFPGGAQAENKTQSASRQVCLVRVRNDGGVEQGRRLQRVFRQEIGTDQQLSLFRDFLVVQQEITDLIKALPKELVYLLVPL